MKKELLSFYAVTDRSWERKDYPFLMQLEDALSGGVTCVQLREKNIENSLFLERGREVLSLCKKYSVPLFINDNLDIAIELGADGVHLGQKDLSIKEARNILKEKKLNMFIGATARTMKEAQKAEKEGADYLGSGALFGSKTKLDALPMSRETLFSIVQSVNIPVVGIGGISQKNILTLKDCGLSGVALVSSIFSSENINSACHDLKKLVKQIL